MTKDFRRRSSAVRPLSVLAIGVLLTTTQLTQAQPDLFSSCSDINYKSDGTKVDTVNKIMAQSTCIRKQQKDRVGTWLCRTIEMVGIRINERGTLVSGSIKPEHQQFTATFTDLFDDILRRSACEREYDLADNRDLAINRCLANFQISFSPRVAPTALSQDGHHFEEAFAKFTLYKTNEFVLFNDEGNAQYVSRGRCVKSH